MTNLRFNFQHLPNDLCLKVLKTMGRHEMIAHSLTSKKALQLVQSLRLPLEKVQISIGWPRIQLDFGHISVIFDLKMGENDEEMNSFDDIPFNVEVSIERKSQFLDNITMQWSWSNQKKSIGEWVQHLCSIFQCEYFEAEFYMEKIRFNIETLRNIFPKLRRVVIHCFEVEPSDHDIQSAQNILRAFLPSVQNVRLFRVPLQENFSIPHIGMTNLKELEIHSPRYLKLDDLLTLNVERCTIDRDQFSLRDLNRFFKLWKKASNPKLKYLMVHMRTIADWNVLMKGLQPEAARRFQAEEDERVKDYIIQSCYGVRARIRMLNAIRVLVSVEFTVLN